MQRYRAADPKISDRTELWIVYKGKPKFDICDWQILQQNITNSNL